MRNFTYKYIVIISFALIITLSSCSSWFKVENNPQVYGKYDHVPQGGGHYKVGEPYEINGKWYYPEVDNDYDQVGIASWYGDYFHGRLTANGEYYDMNALSAAHKTLPLPSYLRVTNLENNKSIVVRLNDRGPYIDDRIIDLSKRAAIELEMLNKGTAKVRVQYMRKLRLKAIKEITLITPSPVFFAKSGEPHRQH